MFLIRIFVLVISLMNFSSATDKLKDILGINSYILTQCDIYDYKDYKLEADRKHFLVLRNVSIQNIQKIVFKPNNLTFTIDNTFGKQIISKIENGDTFLFFDTFHAIPVYSIFYKFENQVPEEIEVTYLEETDSNNKYQNIKKITIKLNLDKDDFRKASFTCEEQIEKEKITIYSKYIAISIFILIMAFILLKFLKRLFILLKNTYLKYKEKVINMKKINKELKEEKNIRKIVEEEFLRETVRDKIKETSNNEKNIELKKLIKDSLEKGDTKTAKILIDLLEE
ncbi:hypothetical protein [Aliarcobacter butzleri]|uniref:hypothetical protein n=1 Tax=Aliarcobacter butzleri TaxID=28197 RepID=UPI002B2454B6|nr:hypothetical protein [Aliarcobacter butzleri]